MVPVTLAGRLINTVAIMGALVMIALPVGIVATAFSEHIHCRDFVVTWAMVARVPLFAGLSAAEIADITRLLAHRDVRGGCYRCPARGSRAFDVFHCRGRG